MKIKRSILSSGIFSIVFIICLGVVSGNSIGVIKKNLKCSGDQNITYSIYLPNNFSEKKNYPLIFSLEPGGRVEIPINLFKNIADEYDYLVVCSKNVRNGPWKDLFHAVKEIWKDINIRFRISGNRVIAAGFSGGSRGASIFSFITNNQPSGIIACGAGLTQKPDYKSLSKSFYYGIAGFSDFNFSEMIRLKQTLDKNGVENVLDITGGTHKWPPKSVLKRAVEVIIVSEMNRGIIEKNAGFKESVIDKFNNYLRELIKNKKLYFADILFNSILKLVQKSGEIKKSLTPLSDNKDFKKRLKKNKIRILQSLDDELRYISAFRRSFALISKSKGVLSFGDISRNLKLNELIRMKKKGSEIKKAMAKRLLYTLSVKGWKFGISNYENKELKKSLFFMKIAYRANPESRFAGFYLAKLLLLNGKKKESIKTLKKIAEKGIDLYHYLLKDPDFKKLSGDSGFIELVEKMKINSQKDKKEQL